MMKKCLAFVLGGGGARGAMQVGALRALFEAGLKPDLLVGTSIGAVNAAGLALWGVNLEGIESLEQAYERVADSGLMDPRLLQFAWNVISKRPNLRGSRYARDFLIAEGVTPEFRFSQIQDVRLALIAADLHTGQPMIYGWDPEQSVLEGVMASIALPPWFAPVDDEGHLVVDGGALSNLPIEPAIQLGATEIIALDLHDPNVTIDAAGKLDPLLTRLVIAISERQLGLELALAAAHHVPVRYVSLRSSPAVQTWDFSTYRDLFKVGYEIMKNEISHWSQKCQSKMSFLRLFTKKQQSWFSG
jgi:NTE family protein